MFVSSYIPSSFISWQRSPYHYDLITADYDPANPQPSRFTQVVWKGTTEIGCAKASCDNIFDPSFGTATYYVCEYSSPGNVIGEFP